MNTASLNPFFNCATPRGVDVAIDGAKPAPSVCALTTVVLDAVTAPKVLELFA